MSRSMNFDVTAQDSASAEFASIAAAAERLEDRLKKLDRLKVEPKVDLNITPATLKANQLKTRLDALKNVRATVQIDGAAEARRDVTALVVEMRKLRNVRVRIDIDGNGRAEMAAFATSLRTLTREVKVKVGLDDGTFARDIARLHQRVSALNGTTVRIKFDIQPPNVRAELEGIAAALRRLRGSTSHRVDVETSAARRSLHETILSFKLLSAAAAVPIAIPGVLAATSSLLSLGGAAVSATGALGLLPAAGAAGGAAMATLALGLAHVADALGPTGTPAQLEKVNEALAKLAPAAREAVEVIRGLGPAFSGMRLEVQERLFAGVSDQIQKLGDTYLPVLKTGLGGIATELNRGATMWAEWAASGPAVADLTTILGNTERTLRALAPAGVNVAAALTDIGVVGSTILPELAGGATEATARFREFIAQARETGQLEEWIRGGLDVLGQLGQVAGNVGGILGGMFRAADAAGADFLGSTVRITGALDDLINSAQGQTQLTAVFRESQAAVDALLPGVRDLTTALLNMLGGFATSTGLQTFTGFLSDAASLVSPLIERLGTLGGETLGNLANGADLAVAGLAPLVGAVSGLVDVLGPVVPLVAAAVIAFKGVALIVPSVVALSTALQVGAVSAAAWAGALTRSATIAAAAGSATLGLGTAVGVLGRALPLLAVAAIAVGFAVDGMTTSTSEAVDVMARGGKAAADLRASLVQQKAAMEQNIAAAEQSRGSYDNLSRSVKYWVQENIFGIATLDSVNAALAEQRANMTALERAQDDVARATRDHQLAVDEFTANSPQARDAAARLADAHEALGAAEDEATRNARSHTEALVEQNSIMRGSIDTAFAYEDAVRKTAEAQQAATDALADSGADSEEYRVAVDELARSMVGQADAAKVAAEAAYAGLGATAAAQAGTAAWTTEILRAADVSSGAGRAAFEKIAGALNTVELNAITAAAETSGLATEIVTLPDGRTVTIVANADRAQLDQLMDDFQGLAGGITLPVDADTAQAQAAFTLLQTGINQATAQITVNGETQGAFDALQTIQTAAANGDATVDINGNTMPVENALSLVMFAIASGNPTVTINGNEVPVMEAISRVTGAVTAANPTMTIGGNADPVTGKITAAVALADGAVATVTLDGDPTLVNGKTQQAVVFADGSRGVITIDGNPDPATGKVNGTLTYADGSTGVITVDANNAPANAKTTASVTFADGSTGVITIDGNPTMANGKTTTAVRFADGSTGVITVDGNPAQARGKITGVVRYGNGSTATVTVNARDLATPVLNRLDGRSTSSIHTVYLRSVGRLPGTLTGLHDGGVIAAASTFHDGGVATAFAGGGTARPFRAGTAQRFPPRHLRYTGDRVDVDEFYLPDNSAARSMALGGEWARRRGMDLVPRNTSEKITMRSAGSAAAGPVARQVVSAMSQARGSGAPVVVAAPVDLRPLAAELRQFVQAAMGRGDQGAVVAAVQRLGDRLATTGPLSAQAHRLIGEDGWF